MSTRDGDEDEKTTVMVGAEVRAAATLRSANDLEPPTAELHPRLAPSLPGVPTQPAATAPGAGASMASISEPALQSLPSTTAPIGVADDFRSGAFRTRFASEAVGLADLFNLIIGTRPLSGPVKFRVELSTPDGPSTGAGTQALQHIKLVPSDGGATLVAGWCNQVDRTAELRTLAYLDAEHARRFSNTTLAVPPAPSVRLDATHYRELLGRLRDFCTEKELRAHVVDAPEVKIATKRRATPSVPIAPREAGRISTLWLLLAVGLAIAAWIALRPR